MAKRRTRRKARPKKQTKLQKALLKRVKKTSRSVKRDYKSEYKRRVAAAKKRYKAELATAKKRRDAALRGAATRKANLLKKKRSEAAKRGAATRKARATEKKAEAVKQGPSRLTSSQIKVITNWHETKFNPHGTRGVPDLDELIEFSQDRGYQGFKDYRRIWDAARANYLKEQDAGTWESRGFGFLVELTTMAKVRPEGEEQWLYYH